MFKKAKLEDMEKMKRITIFVLSMVGFVVETMIIFGIAKRTGNITLAIAFFVLFGALRIDSAEHYKYWLKCLIGTTTIFVCFIILTRSFSTNILTDLLWCVGVSVLFRKSSKKE